MPAPLTYLFLELDQPSAAAWRALGKLAEQWNRDHTSRFERVGRECLITLPKGHEDPERLELEASLAELERRSKTKGVRRPGAPRASRDASSASFILLVGEGCPPGLLTNEIEAWGAPVPCPRCGHVKRSRDRPLTGTLRIDEDLIASDARGDLDFLNLNGGGRLVSKRMADALVACGASGFRLVPLRSTKTEKVSDHYFLLAAEHVVLEPCTVHTPREADAICGECGRTSGSLLDYFHVPRRDLGELSLFSRHRFGLSDLYFTRETYERLQAAGVGSLLASVGLDTCEHDAKSAPSTVIPAVAPSIAAVSVAASGLDAFFEHLADPRPQFVCGASSGRGADEIFDVTHHVEPGCSPSELDAIALELPDARYLRELYLRADGMLLYCDARDRAHAFPSLAAMRRGEVEGESFLRFERAKDWHLLRAGMLENLAMMESAFVAKDGLPFARVSGSSDLLVCAAGAIYYFSPTYNRFHDQVVAKSVDELLGRIAGDPAAFVMDTAAVARFGGAKGLQYFPRRYLSGR